MKKTMTLSEARAYYNEEHCFETETSFLVNDFGKYRPNLTFVVPKTYDLDKSGKPINPLQYIEDDQVTDNMNLDFNGSPTFIFGDFWRSKKGGACFRPKNPMQAKHLLIRVDWGGSFNSHRGNYSSKIDIDELLYFRRASSNGGGSGYDYWILPVGYTHIIHDEEVDGNTENDHSSLFEQRASDYRKKHANLQKEAVIEADVYLKEKAAAEEASIAAKKAFLPRLTEIQAELEKLHQPQKFGRYVVNEISIGDAYFKLNYCTYLYNQKGLEEAEKYLAHIREWISGEEAKRQREADAREAFKPKYEELRGRIERIGWELSFDDKWALVKASVNYHDSGVTSYPFNLDGVENLREDIEKEANRIAEEASRARNAERIHNLLAETELPEHLWFLFEGSEDLDSVIRKEAEAIVAAAKVTKDDVDMHELCNCGFDRRCDAIQRVLSRVGGDVAKININSQAASRELALYIAGNS